MALPEVISWPGRIGSEHRADHVALHKVFNKRFDVIAYGGAVGDGVADDTAAFQATATAAIAASGTLVIGPAPVNYVLTSTLTLQPPGADSQFHMDIEASGYFAGISYSGADNTSVFKSYGWKRSTITGVQVRMAAGKSGIVVWDIDHDATRGSTGVLDFHKCLITHAGGAAAGLVGWRMGHTAGSELSAINWYGCSVEGDGTPSGTSKGWVNEDPNGLNLCWFGCITNFLEQGWTNNSTAGAASSSGGGEMWFYGCGAGYNITDFDFARGGTYGIYGGRFEVGKRFIYCRPGGAVPANVVVSNVGLFDYAGDAVNGRVFEYNQSSGTLQLDNVHVGALTTALTAAMIYLHGTGGNGTLIVNGGTFEAADPFYTLNFGSWNIHLLGPMIVDSSGVVTGRFTTEQALGFMELKRGSGWARMRLAGGSQDKVQLGGISGITAVEIGPSALSSGGELSLTTTAATLVDAVNLVVGTTTGTKIGTATTQKLGFFNATPVVQPVANADTSGAVLADLETEVNQLKATLRTLGLIAT